MTAGSREWYCESDIIYQQYLAAFCAACRMSDLAGNEMFGSPNITPAAIGAWTEAEFLRAMSVGVRPDGALLNSEEMLWESFRLYTDEELRALWAYLQTVTPVVQE
jgi:hypothetical protein